VDEPISQVEVIPQNALTFKLCEDNIKLLAVFEPSEDRIALDVEAIKEMLVQQGLSELFLDKKMLARLAQQYNSATTGFVMEIGGRQDGECTIRISKDRMIAWLTLTPPLGGAAVTLKEIHQSLEEKGIVSGIMVAEIEAAVREGRATDQIIAQGLHPVPGIDAQFHCLMPEVKERRPQIDERGVANYRDLGELVVVEKGDVLMRRMPPSTGEEGYDIMGQVLASKAGNDTPFASGLKGVEFAPEDTDLLLASIIGQPVLVPNGVVVSPTINVPLVDITSGNLSFEGTINIKGDVQEGMKIYAAEDIFVGGTVEAAEIEAGGNIVIKGGVIGNSEPGDGSTPVFGARIVAKGSVSVRFAENASIEAGTDIIIEEYSMNNQLTALNQILVGKSGGKKGHIMGGTASAMILVKAASIGSSAGIKTNVHAGLNPHIYEQLNGLKRGIEANEKEQENIKKIITFVQNNPEKDKDGLLDKAHRTLEKLTSDFTRYNADLDSLQAEMAFAEDAKVIVERAVYSDTEIQIGNQIWRTIEERGKGVFQIIDGEINFSYM
jgi:hypothetical protein